MWPLVAAVAAVVVVGLLLWMLIRHSEANATRAAQAEVASIKAARQRKRRAEDAEAKSRSSGDAPADKFTRLRDQRDH